MVLVGATLLYDYNLVPMTIRQTGERAVACEGRPAMAVPWRQVTKPRNGGRPIDQLLVTGRWRDCDRGNCRGLEEELCRAVNT